MRKKNVNAEVGVLKKLLRFFGVKVKLGAILSLRSYFRMCKGRWSDADATSAIEHFTYETWRADWAMN